MGREVIEIERVGPYGVMVEGEWYGIGKKSDLSPDNFEQGETYTVLTSKSQAGKTYINKVLGADAGGPAKADADDGGEEPAEEAPKPAKKSFGYDSPEKNERILRQGCFQAVAQSPAIVPFILKKEDFVPVVTELAEAIIKKIKGE